MSSHSNIQVYEDSGTAAQRWFIEGSENNYIFKSKQCNYVIDIDGFGKEGDRIQIYEQNNTYSQKLAVEQVFPSTHLNISYDANGGINSPIKQEKISGIKLVLSDGVPSRDGFTFLGWATSNSATTAEYQPGGSYTDDSPITLYAVWEVVASNPQIVSVTTNGIGVVTVNLNRPQQDNTKLIVAVYNDSTLLNMKTETITKSGDIEVPITIPENADKIKAMIWDSMGNLRSLCDEKTIIKSNMVWN